VKAKFLCTAAVALRSSRHQLVTFDPSVLCSPWEPSLAELLQQLPQTSVPLSISIRPIPSKVCTAAALKVRHPPPNPNLAITLITPHPSKLHQGPAGSATGAAGAAVHTLSRAFSD
jgi:hypothetical protein